jgi:hypothetical protein
MRASAIVHRFEAVANASGLWKGRCVRVLIALALLLLLGTFAPPRLFRPAPVPAQSKLWFEAVSLDEDNPERRRVGRLLYLGGWSLRSNDPRFGGLSAIHVEGGELTALSDAGILMRHALPKDRQGMPIEVHALREGPGPFGSKKLRDSEAMAVGPDHLWISYERSNSVWRYRRGDLRAEAQAAPAPMRNWSANSGGEALVRLGGGRFLILSERSRRGNRFSEAMLFDGDPALPSTPARRFLLRGPDGYRVTDAALLPGGRLLFLHRWFSYLGGVSAKLTILDQLDPEEGAVVEPREIAHLQAPLTVDNMEGLSVTREKGHAIVWIASDDNFTGLQRTLLLKFALED